MTKRMTHESLQQAFTAAIKSKSRFGVFAGKDPLCAIHRVPEAFAALLCDVVNAMQRNLHTICPPQNIDSEKDTRSNLEGIALCGIQPASGAIEEDDQLHFCCTLTYVRTSITTINKISDADLSQCESIVIDFTSGEIFSPDGFCTRLLGPDLEEPERIDTGNNKPTMPDVLGKISRQKLTKAWQDLKDNNDDFLDKGYKEPEPLPDTKLNFSYSLTRAGSSQLLFAARASACSSPVLIESPEKTSSLSGECRIWAS